MTDGTQPNERREFLRSALRYLALGLLGAGGLALTTRRRENCERAFICRGCSAVDGCGLPQALSFKQAMGKQVR